MSQKKAFTLIELLLVMAILAIMAALALFALSSLNGAANLNSASYQIKGLLERARSFATANNTYVWVGFYEESAAAPATPGIGRVVISVVASTDGTTVYTLPITTTTAMDPTRLLQVDRLVKINNLHLNNFPTVGTGTGTTFTTRPAVTAASQIGNLNLSSPPNPSSTPFQYPVGSSMPAQYTFAEAIQFSPRGEVRMNNTASPLSTVLEIGLQLTHGSTIDSANPNVAAVQVTGIAGNANIYRQ